MSDYDLYSDWEDDSSNSNDSEKNKSKSVEPKKVLKLYSSRLTEYEREEILKHDKIFFIGSLIKPPKTQFNNGFDDENGAYLYEIHDHIAYRYEILSTIGKGAFGKVLKVFDHKKRVKLALKVIRNKRAFHKQARTEIEILRYLKSADQNDKFNFIKLQSYFIFRNHVCLTFELLTINLYHYLRDTKFIGCSLALVRRFAYSIVKSLCALRELKIIHCDLKLENIVLRSKGKSGIKLIDFGSSCFEQKTCFKYLQSRFYRAPEVICQLKYSYEIDIWSLGCIIAELTSGKVLFKGLDYLHQLALIMEVFGYLPEKFQQTKVYSKELVQSQYYVSPQQENQQKNDPTSSYLHHPNTNISKHAILPGSKNQNFLYERCKRSQELTDFVRKCLIIEPEKRMKAKQALEHKFLNLSKEKVKNVLNQVELLPKSYLIGNCEKTTSQFIKISNLSIN